MQTGTITTVYHLCEIWQDSQQQQQPPFYDHYTGQPAFTGTSSSSSLQHTHPFTYTHTHPFNGPFSGTTQVSRYQRGKTNLDFTETRDSEWQWHQLGHMQVCTSLQRDNHISTPPLFFTGRMPFLPPNQQRQSTEGSRVLFNSVILFYTDSIPQQDSVVRTYMEQSALHDKTKSKDSLAFWNSVKYF